MNNSNQNHTDNFFKQGLSSPPEFAPSDKNWSDMERLLNKEPKRRIRWIYPIAGIAAALLIFCSLWLISDNPVTDMPREEIAGGKVNDQENKADNDQGPAVNTMQKPDVKNTAENLVAGKTTPYTSVGKTILPGSVFVPDNVETPSPLSPDRGALDNARYLTIKGSRPGEFATLSNLEMTKLPGGLVNEIPDVVKATDQPPPSLPGRWTLSLALSPDLNTVKEMEDSDFGLSMGVGVTYRLGKTLSVGTGVYYSQKLYSADKTSYKVKERPFATWTSYSKRIDADCRVIDIPLNFSMQVAARKQNRLYASAGLSSYIMLSEKYAFLYNPSPAYPTGRREYTIKHENKHYLSVVNLGLALERPLSKQVSLVIQPYAKLPLTGIGKGETDLKSFGLGFKLNYSLKKKNAFTREHTVPTPIADQE